MDRRRKYLDTALELFIEHGFHGVSMDTIVAAAGGSKATLYRYFDSKQALFEAIIDNVVAGLTPPDMPADYLDLPLEDGLRILGHATATAALSEGAVVLTQLASAEINRFPELAAQLYERGPGLSYRRFCHFLEIKHDRGEIELTVDPLIAAEQFLSSIVGHQQLRMVLGVGAPSSTDVEARLEAAIATFVRTYAAQPAETH